MPDAAATAPAPADAEAALSFLTEMSPDLRGGAILAGDGTVLAASGDATGWAEEAVNRIDAFKLSGLLRTGLDSLPARQREVVLLRDVESMTSAEVCEVLAISEANQRVLLHRGRSKLRLLLESELGGGGPR